MGSVVLGSVVGFAQWDCIDSAGGWLFPLVSATCFADEKHLGVSRPPGKRAVYTTKAAAERYAFVLTKANYPKSLTFYTYYSIIDLCNLPLINKFRKQRKENAPYGAMPL